MVRSAGWGEETDMAELEKSVRAIEMDGLLWGAAGLEDVGYGEWCRGALIALGRQGKEGICRCLPPVA